MDTGIEATETTAPVETEGSTVTSDVGDSAEIGLEPEASTPAVESYKWTTSAGEEYEATLEDLQGGYLRQSDYTRKTQEIAKLRSELHQAEALRQALETDPRQTLRALNEAYGMTYPQEQAGFQGDEAEPLDPWEQEVVNLQERVQQFEFAQRRQAIESELSRLHGTGTEFDDIELLTFANRNGIQNLEVALRAMKYDDLAQANAKAQAEAQVTEQKRTQLAAVESTGGHRGSQAAPPKVESIWDAFRLAKSQS